jgi:hypothetical protein
MLALGNEFRWFSKDQLFAQIKVIDDNQIQYKIFKIALKTEIF